MIASGEDLHDFFNQFETSSDRTKRNVMASPLTAKQASYVFGRRFDESEAPVW